MAKESSRHSLSTDLIKDQCPFALRIENSEHPSSEIDPVHTGVRLACTRQKTYIKKLTSTS